MYYNKYVNTINFQKLLKAYFDCRKNKRNSASALEFEINLEKNLLLLHEELLHCDDEILRYIIVK